VSIDVKKLRQNLKMTQDEFAEKFHINVCTLRDWEQGRYHPTGPARVLLMVIERTPAAVLDAVEAA
jgi:putative transcriptional regulator